jgi:hypothetical protein
MPGQGRIFLTLGLLGLMAGCVGLDQGPVRRSLGRAGDDRRSIWPGDTSPPPSRSPTDPGAASLAHYFPMSRPPAAATAVPTASAPPKPDWVAARRGSSGPNPAAPAQGRSAAGDEAELPMLPVALAITLPPPAAPADPSGPDPRGAAVAAQTPAAPAEGPGLARERPGGVWAGYRDASTLLAAIQWPEPAPRSRADWGAGRAAAQSAHATTPPHPDPPPQGGTGTETDPPPAVAERDGKRPPALARGHGGVPRPAPTAGGGWGGASRARRAAGEEDRGAAAPQPGPIEAQVPPQRDAVSPVSIAANPAANPAPTARARAVPPEPLPGPIEATSPREPNAQASRPPRLARRPLDSLDNDPVLAGRPRLHLPPRDGRPAALPAALPAATFPASYYPPSGPPQRGRAVMTDPTPRPRRPWRFPLLRRWFGHRDEEAPRPEPEDDPESVARVSPLAARL